MAGQVSSLLYPSVAGQTMRGKYFRDSGGQREK
jgi:hypothetical protein